MTRAEAIELAMTERRRHGLPGFDGRCHCGYVGDWTTDERFDAWSRHVEGDIIDALLVEAGMTFGEEQVGVRCVECGTLFAWPPVSVDLQHRPGCQEVRLEPVFVHRPQGESK